MTALVSFPRGILEYEPLNESYVQKLPDKLSRTDFEQGLARQRRRWRSAVTTFSVRWPMSPQQRFIFDGWLEWGIVSGEAFFNIPVFTNASYQMVQARFVKDSIDPTREGGEWIISAKIEVLDYPSPSEADTTKARLTYGSSDDLLTLANRLHHIVHVEYPAAVTIDV